MIDVNLLVPLASTTSAPSATATLTGGGDGTFLAALSALVGTPASEPTSDPVSPAVPEGTDDDPTGSGDLPGPTDDQPPMGWHLSALVTVASARNAAPAEDATGSEPTASVEDAAARPSGSAAPDDLPDHPTATADETVGQRGTTGPVATAAPGSVTGGVDVDPDGAPETVPDGEPVGSEGVQPNPDAGAVSTPDGDVRAGASARPGPSDRPAGLGAGEVPGTRSVEDAGPARDVPRAPLAPTVAGRPTGPIEGDQTVDALPPATDDGETRGPVPAAASRGVDGVDRPSAHSVTTVGTGDAQLQPDEASAATSTTRATSSRHADVPATINRVLEAVEMLEKAPPPRQLTLEFGDVRLRLSLEDGHLRLSLLGEGSAEGSELLEDALAALAERGFDLGGDGRQEGEPAEDDTTPAGSTVRPTVRRTNGLRL